MKGMSSTLPWKLVWVTGASTGIGREVAMQLAARGVIVAVSARSAEKLSDMGSNVKPYPLDVTDAAAAQRTIDRIESELGPIDLALMAAGAYAPVDVNAFSPEPFAKMMGVNFLGVVNCIAGLLPVMKKRKRGRIAWIASVAGYRGLPKAAGYGPSKAALINLAESIAPELAVQGIDVSVVNPGFVATPMTAKNDFPMPFLMTPKDAARRTIEGLAAGKFEVAYPTRFVIILKIARLLPYSLYFWLIKRGVLSKET
jgi:NAD(P)-dependent dehydrogenase (short-subunit alcohol dehydrogenase family)